MRVIVLCESSGVVREAFRARGHEAYSCDLLPADDASPFHFQCDALELLKERTRWDLMIAHPTCTRLTNAGARWLTVPPPGRSLNEMWEELAEGAAFYMALRDARVRRRAIENPIMHRHARALINPGPRQVVQPWWFGDEAFKATGLELINLPPLVATNKLTPPKAGTIEHKRWSAIHRASPGPNRWKIRSRFFPGMAAAMAEQWGSL